MTFEFNFLLVAIMQIIAYFIQGCTGFGCAVIAAPVTTGLLGTTVGVPYGTLMSLPTLIFLGVAKIREVSWKDLSKILLMCAPGMIVGNYLFYRISPNTAKIAIGAMVSMIAIMNIYKWIVKPCILKQEVVENDEFTLSKKIFAYGCLLVGGIVHGAFNIGGPLITVYTISAVHDKEKFRNTMTWVWIILNSVNAINQYRNGLVTPYLMSALAVGLPMAVIGLIMGIKFLKKIDREQFLRIVYVILFIVGADMFIRSLMAL